MLAVLLLVASAPPLPDATVQATSEAAILSVGGDTPSTAIDVAVNPQAKAAYRDGTSTLVEGGYVGSYRLRQAANQILPYALHRLEGTGAVGRETGGVRLTGLASLVVGESTFDNVNENLEQPFGLTTTTTIVPVASFDLAGNLSHRPVARLILSSGARARAYATPAVDENGAPEGAFPSGGVGTPFLLVRGDLVPQLRAGADVQAAYVVTRRDLASVRVDVDGVTLLDRFGYASLAGSVAWQHRLSRAFDVRAAAGAFAAFAPDASPPVGVLPAGELTVSTSPLPIAGVRPTMRVRAAVEPFYDPFLLVLTERAAVDGSVAVPFSRALSMSLALGGAARLIEFAPKDRAGRGDDVYAQAVFGARYAPWRTIAIDAGINSSIRARAPRADRGLSTTPTASAFVSVTALHGFAW